MVVGGIRGGGEKWEIAVSWVQSSFSLGIWKKSSEKDHGDYTTVWMFLLSLNYALNNGENSKFYVIGIDHN